MPFSSRESRTGALVLTALVAGVLATETRAADGIIEINQACAVNTGCLPGDTPGFPVSIDDSTASSFRLTSDLTVPDAATTAIVLAGHGISVDLNGFSLRGGTVCADGACSPTGVGVGIAGDFVSSAEVRNGSVVGMGSNGVVVGRNSRVENVRAQWNGGTGISAALPGGVVTNCESVTNGGHGIEVGSGGTVLGSRVASNVENGIKAGIWSTIVGNSARSNSDKGISAGSGSRIETNTSAQAGAIDSEVTDYGIECFDRCSVQNNTVSDNVGAGIWVQNDSQVIGSSSSANDGAGIICEGTGCTIKDSIANGNAAGGIVAGDSAVLIGNQAVGNTGAHGGACQPL